MQTNWEIVRYYLSQIAVGTGSSDITKEFITLSDIYHSLGAGRVALLLSYVVSVIYIMLKVATDSNSIWARDLFSTGLGILFITLIALSLHGIFSRTRAKALDSTQSFLGHSCYSYFAGRLHKLK